MAGVQKLTFSISLSAEQFLRYYRGSAHSVIVRADDGRRIQLPANSLRPFVGKDGIYGRFQLSLDENNRIITIDRLA